MTWWPFSKSEPQVQPQDPNKMLEENKIALNGMTQLVQKLQSTAPEEQQGVSMEEYLARLRREGSGL